MSLEVLSRTLVSRAKDQVQETQKSLDLEKENLQKSFEESILSFENKLKFSLDESISRKQKKLSTQLNSLKRKVSLESFQELEEEILSKTLQRLEELDIYRKKPFFKALYSSAKSEMKIDIVWCSKKDISLVKSIVDSKVQVKSKENFSGLLFENLKDKTLINCSIENVLKEMFNEIREEVLSEIM